MTTQLLCCSTSLQLKQIKKELGLEKDDKEALIAKYRKRLADLNSTQAPTEDADGDETEAGAELGNNEKAKRSKSGKKREWMAGCILIPPS
jgi:hypothetical protein